MTGAGNRSFAGITGASVSGSQQADYRTVYATDVANAYTTITNPDYAAFSGRVDSGDPLVYDYKREPDPVLDKWIPQSEIPKTRRRPPSSNTFSTRR